MIRYRDRPSYLKKDLEALYKKLRGERVGRYHEKRCTLSASLLHSYLVGYDDEKETPADQLLWTNLEIYDEPLFNVLLFLPLTEMPLYLNNVRRDLKIIAQWRLQLGK